MEIEHEKSDGMEIELRAIRDQLKELAASVQQIRQLVGPIGIPMPDGTMLTHTIHGQKYFIDPTDSIIAPQMIVYRQWEADLSSLLRKLCNRDTVFVDVGANFGYFTCLAASLIGTSGSGLVHSVEPTPHLAALLRRNIEINWSSAPVIVHEAAAADQSGQIKLHIPHEHGANATLTPLDLESVETVLVPAIRLDDALPPSLVVDVMKIDVEGHELTVLKGSPEVLKRSPKIQLIMEWPQGQMRAAGVSPEEMRNFLDGFNLKPFEISRQGQLSDGPVSWDWLENQGYANIVFRNALP